MRIKTIYTEITNQCNLNCATCYNRSGQNMKRLELSIAEINHIIQCFLPYGLQRFLLSGGEPTLHSQFDELLDLIQHYPQINFGIVTNGTNPSPKLLELLNTSENLFLQISLDGSCDEINAQTRGRGNFAKTLSFAKQIKTPKQIPLLKMVVSQDNYEDVEDFCNLALSMGFMPEIAFIYKAGNGSNNWQNKELKSLQKLKILQLVDRINKERNTAIFLPKCTSHCPLAENLDSLSICIKTDGSIQPCQALYHSEYTVGNIHSLNFQVLNENLRKISDIARLRSQQEYNCQKCILKEACGRGCMAEAVNLYGNPLANDGNCDYRKRQFIHLHLKNGDTSPIRINNK